MTDIAVGHGTNLQAYNMKVQEVIDKLNEYKDLAGNRKVSIRSNNDDSEHEITNIGWDPFQKQIKILIW